MAIFISSNKPDLTNFNILNEGASLHMYMYYPLLWLVVDGLIPVRTSPAAVLSKDTHNYS